MSEEDIILAGALAFALWCVWHEPAHAPVTGEVAGGGDGSAAGSTSGGGFVEDAPCRCK